MQAAYHTSYRPRVVILDELGGQAQRFKLVSPESFREEAAAVLENVRDQYNYVFQVHGLDSNLHTDIFDCDLHSPLFVKGGDCRSTAGLWVTPANCV